ncbi:methylated-DNA--[protein]-cysteine S-methyltransferase [Sphingomonas flavalba]|uniref:methylated-DNA--[protein]-cysteine S-methyltransferase n=1 Tax=Sphingomonas flavalba TaxID=2559804 RepID=UPI0039E0DABE
MAYAPVSASIATPVGTVHISGDDDVVHAIHITAATAEQAPTALPHAVAEAARQIAAYFTDPQLRFCLPLAPAATARGMALREAIAAIGPGATQSYGEVAAAIASSPRAVGQACARNPFPIVIPCHRVLAGGGRLGAYSAGGGIRTKSWLLHHEGMKGPLL